MLKHNKNNYKVIKSSSLTGLIARQAEKSVTPLSAKKTALTLSTPPAANPLNARSLGWP